MMVTLEYQCLTFYFQAQELIDSISSLEITVSKLETDLNDLRYQLGHVRTERLLVENDPECLLSTPSTSKCTWDEVSFVCCNNLIWKFLFRCGLADGLFVLLSKHTSILRDFKFGEYEPIQSMEEYLCPGLEEQHDAEKESENREKVSPSGQLEEHQDVHLNILLEEHQDEEVLFHACLPVSLCSMQSI